LNTALPTESVSADSFQLSALDFAALLDASPEAVMTLDRDLRITYANPEALRVSQLSLDDTIGRLYWDVRPMTRGTLVEENLLAVMRERVTRRFEYFSPPANAWLDILLKPFADGVAFFYK